MAEKITYRFVDTGHWLARCDHSTNVIELNRNEFFRLSPMIQDYIWVHEHVHLLYNIYGEKKCNSITDEIFISRAKSAEERAERIKFVVSSNDAEKSHSVTAVIGALIGVGSAVSSAIMKVRNSGYYSLDERDRMIFVDSCLKEAFEESLLTDQRSAKEIFWEKMKPTIARKNEQTYESWVAKNTFCRDFVSQYESLYGFSFFDITPVRSAVAAKTFGKTAGIIAVLVAVMVLAVVLIKKKRR